MNCPYCGNEMTEGYIQSREQLYFNKGRKARFIASGDLGSISLSRFNLVKAPSVKAYHCRRCRKLIVDLA